jgi:putative membrane protein
MQTLILCIDRDNDLGEKADIRGPLIGREANIEAAVKLGTADPEDSDTNTIFGGIRVLDDLLAKGIDAEIVTLAGDRSIGIISDQKIANQLDLILKKFNAESAIFISDGAEDETLLPIVQSRIKIDSVKRIVVMQSANLESTYYIIKHAFNDPKISQTFFVPLGLASLIYAFFLLIDYPQGAVIGILAAIGLYMLYRGFGDSISILWGHMNDSFYSGRMTFVTYAIAGVIFALATIVGLVNVWNLYTSEGVWYYGIVPLVTVFINSTVWLYTGAILFADLGKIIDCKKSGRSVFRYIIPAFFAISMGLLFWGASTYLMSINPVIGSESLDSQAGVQYFVYSIVAAIIIALLGIKISTNIKMEEKKGLVGSADADT